MSFVGNGENYRPSAVWLGDKSRNWRQKLDNP